MNSELFEALEVIEKEKNISKESILEAVKQSLIQAVRNQYQRPELENLRFEMNPDTREFEMYAEKTVVENVEDPLLEMTLADARMIDGKHELGDIVRVPVESKNFGSKTQMKLKYLTYVHTGRNAERIQYYIKRTTIRKEWHIFNRKHTGNDTLVTMTSGHLISD